MAATGGGDSHVLKFTRTASSWRSMDHRTRDGRRPVSSAKYRAAATIPTPSAAREDLRGADPRSKPTSGGRSSTLTSRFSTPIRGNFKPYWGAYGNKPTDDDLAPTTRTRRRPSSSATPSTTPTFPTTEPSMSAIASTIGFRSSPLKASSSRSRFIAKNTLGLRLGVGHRARRSAAAVYLRRGWPERRRSTSSIASRCSS